MSGLLAGKVWQSALDPKLKPLAAALADIASDDGTSIYPSVSYVAWLLGVSERTVQYHMRALEDAGVLIAAERPAGGRRPVTYRLDEAALPSRTAWRDRNRGAKSAPLDDSRGADCGTLGVQTTTLGVQIATLGVQPVAPDPLGDPLEDPSLDPVGRATRAPRPQADTSKLIDDAFIGEMVAEFAGDLGGAQRVRERIEAALNHKASDKWKNKRLGIRTWLRRDVERELERGAYGRRTSHGGDNGGARPAGTASPYGTWADVEAEQRAAGIGRAASVWMPDDDDV